MIGIAPWPTTSSKSSCCVWTYVPSQPRRTRPAPAAAHRSRPSRPGGLGYFNPLKRRRTMRARRRRSTHPRKLQRHVRTELPVRTKGHGVTIASAMADDKAPSRARRGCMARSISLKSISADADRAEHARRAATAPSPVVGSMLERYRIGDVLGQGGMGEVLSARDEQIGREVAIKRMRVENPTPEVARAVPARGAHPRPARAPGDRAGARAAAPTATASRTS